MPAIRIQAPDNSIIEFPEGTSDDTITSVMQREFGGPQSPAGPPAPPAAAMAPVTPDDGGVPAYAPGQTPVVGAAPTMQGSQAPQPVVQPGAPTALARGIAQGATLGFADEIYGAGAATAGKGYATGRDAYRTGDAAARAANPGAFTTAEIGAGVLGGAGLPSMVGRGGGLIARSLASGGVGAGYGAVQGLGNAQGGAADQLSGTALGLAFGGGLSGLAPAAGAGVGSATSKIAELLAGRNVTAPGFGRQSIGMLAEDLTNSGGTGNVRQRLGELGDEAMLLDASPSFGGRAQGLAVRPETRQAVMDPVVARNQGTNQRLAAEIEGALGPAPVPSEIQAAIGQGQEALGPRYGQAFQGATAVNTEALAQQLEAGIVNSRGNAQRAMRGVRGDLDIPGAPGNLDPNPQALLQTRQAIDGRLATEADPNTIRVLTAARQQVDQELTRTVPGIKDVDAQYAELARQREGLQRGSQIIDSGKTATRPEDLAQELTAAVQPQGTMVGPSAVPLRMRQGTRAEIDRIVGTNANDLVALRNAIKGEGDWNRAKLAQVFGDEEAGRVFNAVDRETAFRDAYNRLVSGSQTSMREQAARGVMPRGEGGPSGDAIPGLAGAVGGPYAMAAAYGSKALGAINGGMLRASDITRNQEMARAVTMRPGSDLDVLLDMLAQRSRIGQQSQAAGTQADQVAQALLMTQGGELERAARRRGYLGR